MAYSVTKLRAFTQKSQGLSDKMEIEHASDR